MGILESAFSSAHYNRRGSDSPYYDLAFAVIKTAVDDYRTLRKSLARSSRYDRPVIQGRLREIELFFHSSYADVLCLGHAEYIWRLLRKEYGA